MKLEAKALKLHDEDFGNQWVDEVLNKWNYPDFLKNPRWRKGWISMDCCLYNCDDEMVYLGITSFDADIFKAYDRKSGKFADLGYSSVVDPFDAKFHRSLLKSGDGSIYAATALLHDVNRFPEAPGGSIIKYVPSSGAVTKLCVPIPHVYIQSIVFDESRDTIYCMCFAPEYFASFNVKTGVVKNHGLIGSGIGGMAQGENIEIDDSGCVWCNWQVTRAWQWAPGPDAARLCKFDPESGKMIFYDSGLPVPDGSYGTIKAEAFFNFHTGCMHASGAGGALYRINGSGKAEYLFTAVKDRPSRLASMTVAPDGCAYGVVGRDGRCELLKYDFKSDKYELLGEIVDKTGARMWQAHDICATPDGILYACENDNPHRSGYLWEIRV